jgi:hypothetical protein
LTSFVLTIAGTSFNLIPESPDCPYSLADAYQPFLTTVVNSVSPAACGRYRILTPDHPRLLPISGESFWSNEIWRMGNTRTGTGIEIFDVINSRWMPVANLTEDFSEGSIQPFYGRRAAPAPHALNYPYDQAILINRLLFNNVVVIHGAGIVLDGKGYIFFGPSGIGKTTISRLWVKRGAQLLNDDRVALYQTGDGWKISGTPWHGEEPVVSPLNAPLAGVVRLRQAPYNRVRQLTDIEGLSQLLACALIPFFSKSGLEQSINIMEQLADVVPMVELSLKPEDAALEHFLDAMSHISPA